MKAHIEVKQNTKYIHEGGAFHYGTLTTNGKEYPFTIHEIITNDNATFDITWAEDTPNNKRKSEKVALEALGASPIIDEDL